MIVIALTATVLSVELILVISALISRVPIAVDPAFLHSILWHYQRSFQPQRNLFSYCLWLALSVGIYACLWGVMELGKHRAKWDLNPFLMVHALVACLMCHAAFEIVAVGNPMWAWPVFWTAFVSGVLVSVFWPEFRSSVSFLKGYFASLKISPWVGPALGCLYIFLVIFMPDVQAVVAMVFMGDYFHNWDFSILGPVYAIAHGLIPDVDVSTTYGFGACVMLAKMVNLMGGFEYFKVLAIVMWVAILYFALWFLLLRHFLASSLLAFAAVVCAMRMQMFNSMIEPSIWVTLTSSAFRYCFDVGVFWMLWEHMQTRRIFFLAAAAFFVSLALFHLLSTGMTILLVFVLYACASACMPCLGGGKDLILWRNHAIVIASVLAWSVLWFYMAAGRHVFEGAFLQNLSGFNSYFIKGEWEGPLIAPLSGNNPVSSIGGMLYPVFYMVTFLYVAGEVIVGKARARDVFAGLLSFYGLEAHSYYMLMVTQWYTMGIPGCFLFFYWLTKATDKVPVIWRKRMAWGLVVAAVYCLMTSRWFTGYPNLMNGSPNPIVDSRTAFRVGPRHVPYFHQLLADFPDSFKLPVNSLGEKDEQLKYEKDFASDDALKTYFAQQTAWPEDTAMIRRLTPEGGRVAIISSFEVLFLKGSDRKPFFYYYPLINSRPLTVRNFMVTYHFSYPQLQKDIDQLEAQKPPYIFMERIFLTQQVPMAYFYEFDDLISLLRYVRSKYVPSEVGKYLVAMKRV